MKQEITETLRAICTALGVSTLIGVIGAGIRQLYDFKHHGGFNFISLIISMLVGGFTGWLVGHYTDEYAIVGICAVLSDQIFKVLITNADSILNKILGTRFGFNNTDNDKKDIG